MTIYDGRLRDERETGCCLRQAQAACAPAACAPAACAPAACAPAASSLAELVEASEDMPHPPTVLTLAARGPNGQARLNHAVDTVSGARFLVRDSRHAITSVDLQEEPASAEVSQCLSARERSVQICRGTSVARLLDGTPCESHAQGTKARQEPRLLFVPSQPEHEFLQTARAEPQTEAFRAAYALRSGVERLMAQGMRAFELRKARSIGCARTHLQHILIAVAINLVRFIAWVHEPHPTRPRRSAFTHLDTLT